MIKNLTSLRFVFIFLIYLSHISYMGFPQFDFGGECGVAFFFVLSGFVLARRYGEEIEQGAFKHKRFVGHQLAKFYPLHIALIAILTILGTNDISGEGLFKLLLSVLLVQSWIPDISYYFAGNAVSWFLSDILFLYLVFPYLYKVGHLKRTRLFFLSATVVVLYVVFLLSVPVGRYNDCVYAPPLLRSIDFTLGIIAYRVYKGIEGMVCKKATVCILEISTLALGAITFLVYPHVDPRFHCAMLLWPMSFAFVLVFALSDRYTTALTRLLHSRVLLLLGSISLEIFLTHPLINWNEYVVLKKMGFDVNTYPLVYIVPCFIGVAIGSWLVKKYFVDKLYCLLTKGR